MIFLLIIGLISSVYAAPQFDGMWYPEHHEHYYAYQEPWQFPQNHGPWQFPQNHGPWEFPNHSQFDNINYMHGNIYGPDFHKTMQDLNNMLTGISQNSLNVVQESFVGNEYKITILLSGFEIKDIIVKAREGYVSIQANHKYSEDNENIYSNSRILPATVDLNGKWTYQGGVLNIMFPLKEGIETQTVRVIRTEPTTSSEEDTYIDERTAT